MEESSEEVLIVSNNGDMPKPTGSMDFHYASHDTLVRSLRTSTSALDFKI